MHRETRTEGGSGDSRRDFGSLGELCLSSAPGERRELFGEFSSICLPPKVKPADPRNDMDRLSLTRSD